jgi:hypothetical protein
MSKKIVRFLTAFWYKGPFNRVVIFLIQLVHKNIRVPINSVEICEFEDYQNSIKHLKMTGFSKQFKIKTTYINQVLQEVDLNNQNKISNPHLKYQSVKSIVYNEKIIQLVAQYLQVQPKVHSSYIIVSNQSNIVHNPSHKPCEREFHYDVSDFKSCALFVYLNDVDEFGGSHVIIPNSTKMTWNRYFSRVLPTEIANKRYDVIERIVGVLGTAFIEDLNNWHKKSASNYKRLVLCVNYTILR